MFLFCFEGLLLLLCVCLFFFVLFCFGVCFLVGVYCFLYCLFGSFA